MVLSLEPEGSTKKYGMKNSKWDMAIGLGEGDLRPGRAPSYDSKGVLYCNTSCQVLIPSTLSSSSQYACTTIPHGVTVIRPWALLPPARLLSSLLATQPPTSCSLQTKSSAAAQQTDHQQPSAVSHLLQSYLFSNSDLHPIKLRLLYLSPVLAYVFSGYRLQVVPSTDQGVVAFANR